MELDRFRTEEERRSNLAIGLAACNLDRYLQLLRRTGRFKRVRTLAFSYPSLKITYLANGS